MDQPVIDRKRLAACFEELVRIDSVSKEEGAVARHIREKLSGLGLETRTDKAGDAVNGQTGNIVAYFRGNVPGDPLLLAAHMDTVEPGRGIIPTFANGVFTSAGDTILGADDKSAIAILFEILQCIREQDLPCGPLEILFTICEEVGLLGAKNLDYNLISARMGYALDTKSVEAITTQAPAANRLDFHIYGKAAHAGSTPELGINAISLASRAIAQLELGRIDHETTCNIGVIEGGLATNIVPDRVVVKGEVRSHNRDKLERVTNTIVSTFQSTIASYKTGGDDDLPKLKASVSLDFDQFHLEDDHPVVALAQQAARNLGRRLETISSGGGADANIFYGKGIPTAVLGTGMDKVHTLDELIRLDDMVSAAELVLEIIRLKTI